MASNVRAQTEDEQASFNAFMLIRVLEEVRKSPGKSSRVLGAIAFPEGFDDPFCELLRTRLIRQAGKFQFDPTTCEDLFQATLLVLWEKYQNKPAPEIVRVAAGIMENKCLEECRRRNRKPVPIGNALANLLPSAGDSPEEALQKKQVLAAFKVLGAEHREVLELYSLGYTPSEIAERTGKSRRYVDVIKFRGLRRIREFLGLGGEK